MTQLTQEKFADAILQWVEHNEILGNITVKDNIDIAVLARTISKIHEEEAHEL